MMTVYIRYNVHSLSGLLVMATKLFFKRKYPMASEVVTLHYKKCYVDRGWYCPQSVQCPSLLGHKVGGAVVVPPPT